METKWIRKMMIAGILLLTAMSACAQQENRQTHTIVPIDHIYLQNKDRQIALNNLTSQNVQEIFGKPVNVDIYNEQWSDECDKITTYEYDRLSIRFWSLENEEWLHHVESSSFDVSVIIDGVHLFAGVKDSVLNVFEKSWETYQNLENTTDFQNMIKKGYSEKFLILKFPIKIEDYEYFGSMYVSIKDGIITKIEFSLQDEA